MVTKHNALNHLICLTLGSVFVLLLVTVISDKTLAQISLSVTNLAWNSNGTLLAVAHDNGVVDIQNISGQVLVSIDPAAGSIRSVSWSPTDNSKLGQDFRLPHPPAPSPILGEGEKNAS